MVDRIVSTDVRERVDEAVQHLNQFGYDQWGASRTAAKRVLSLVSVLYKHYFRVETQGLENIPVGRALLIGNHSSQLAYDGMLVCAAMCLEANPPRFLRAMIERFFAETPVVNILMTRVGQLTGIPSHASQLLDRDQAVLVFPEGHRGGGRVWRDRYKMMGFGQGFMRLALKSRAPIVPFGFIGGEEMCPSFSRMEPLARMMGAPYFPLSPTVVPLPLPAKVHIVFGEPMRFEGTGDEADQVVAPMVREVEQAVTGLIAQGLTARRAVFW